MATVLEKSKKKRTVLRRNATITMKELADSNIGDQLLEVKRTTLKNLANQLKELDDAIFDAMLDVNEDEDVCFKETSEATNIQEEIRKTLLECERSKNASGTTSTSSTAGSYQTSFPKLTLEKYDVNPGNWINFWSQFRRIHEADMDEEAKFQYLKMSICGAARSLVESYPCSATNYAKVIDHLKSRYGRTDLIVHCIYRELLGLIRNRPSITVLYDTVISKIRGLESLGISSKNAEILVPLIEECLPVEVLKLWERCPTNEINNVNKLEALLTFLGKEAESSERLENIERVTARPTAAALVVKASVSKEKLKRHQVICAFCKGNHYNKDCTADMTVQERKAVVEQARLCFACLRPGHTVSKCRIRVDCINCKGRHFVMMCSKKETPSSNDAALFVCPSGAKVVLQTLLAKIGDRVVRILIDSGSHRSYVSSALCRELGLPSKREEKLQHVLFGGTISELVTHYSYDLRLEKLDGKVTFVCEALNQDTICGDIPSYQFSPKMLSEAGITLADDGKNRPIDILIGADNLARLIKSVQTVDSLLAFETVLGWCILGSMKAETSSMVNTVFSLLSCTLPNLWELESLGIEDPSIRKDSSAECIEFFKRTVRMEPDGRYEVCLPWINEHPPLVTERSMAEERLWRTVKRLRSNGLFEAYSKVLLDWQAEGIIEQLGDDCPIVGHYLPHRPVLKEGKTTKIRPVFDASARQAGQVSLNECLYTGPNLVAEILPLLLRFRLGKVGLIADIKQAFLMIGLSSMTDRDMLRFLWVSDNKVITFRHCRVVFGLSASPFLLNATLAHHLNQFSSAVSDQLKNSLYIDDCVTSVRNLKEANGFKREACEIMSAAKFELRGWKFSGDEGDLQVLGIRWLASPDLLGCCKPKWMSDTPLTKRSLLSLVGRLYDPLGVLAAPILFLKIILQQCFRLKLNWNDLIPVELRDRVNRWLSELNLIEEILIPRCINSNSAVNVQLHVFSDASSFGMGTCVFLRCELNGNVDVSFVAGKARVAPLSSVTIPRLELLAAGLATRLGVNVKSTLKINDITFWTDSMIVLYWIKKGEWKAFVGNRVREIRKLTETCEWKFVPGSLNPADVLSRGCMLSEFVETKGWEAPSWLFHNREKWPEVSVVATKDALLEQVVSLTNVSFDNSLFSFFDSFKKNVRVLGWIYRFFLKCKGVCKETSDLSAEELLFSEEKLIAWIQKSWPPSTEGINTLTDSNGMIRVCSKVFSKKFSESFRNPIVLSSCPLVKSLIRERHIEMHHAGCCWLLNDLREKYWIVNGRRITREIIKKCVRCQKFRSKAIVTPPIGLPDNRVNLGKVFEVSGCDLAGPLFLKDGRKMWIVLYTCAVYRAVHLELVDSLSTESFVNSLRRMIARRGRIRIMYSDHGSNFVGAWNNIKRQAVEDLKISWIFNVPTGSWWGGFFERLIGIMKGLLKSTLANASLNYDELHTLVVEVEATLNKRPITYLSDDATEPKPITPSMFLQQEETEVSAKDLDEVDANSLNCRIRHVNSVRNALKNRFAHEYLGALLLRKAGITNENHLQEGSVVWVGDDNKKRQDWSLGKILQLYPGKDKVSRVARLKTSKGELLRPVQKLYPLEGVQVGKYVNTEPETLDEPMPAAVDVLRSSSGRRIKAPTRLDL